MAEEAGKEIPSGFRIPKVDRQTVRNLFVDKEKSFADRLDKFYASHPILETSIGGGFTSLSEEYQNSIYIGAGVAAVLLADSQPRTGGIIPEELNQDVINTTLKSAQDTGGNAFTAIEQLMDKDPELFFGLTYLAVKMNVKPSPMLQGGLLLLQIYEHVLEGKRLEKGLGY